MPLHNADIAAIFGEIADLLEIRGENPFRIRAYRNAARTIAEFGQDIKNLLAKGGELPKLPGIGNDLSAKIHEIAATGTCRLFDRLHKEFPPAISELLKVPGLGPKRVRVLYERLQVDLRRVPAVSYGAALHYFTGSKAHNIAIRRLAQTRGLKLNEYGVFHGTSRIAGDTEESVFKAVGLPYIPPELREDRGEIEAARSGNLPELITLQDIRGDLHAHTGASDGHNTLAQMAQAAQDFGLKYLAITEHSRRLTVAHGLDPQQLAKQIDEIDRLNASLAGFTLLKGIEVDILEDGSLDLPDTVLARLDLVIGAVHSAFALTRRKQTKRILRAMDHRYFTMLAHPSGRLIGHREACDIDHLQYGIGQARRGWLAPDDVLNTRTLAALKPLVKRTMQ